MHNSHLSHFVALARPPLDSILRRARRAPRRMALREVPGQGPIRDVVLQRSQMKHVAPLFFMSLDRSTRFVHKRPPVKCIRGRFPRQVHLEGRVVDQIRHAGVAVEGRLVRSVGGRGALALAVEGELALP